MRSYGFFAAYDVERVNPHGIATRFTKDIEKIHGKSDRLEHKQVRGRAKASESNTRKFRRVLNVTRELLRRGFSVEGIADKIGKSVRQVYRHKERLLELGETWESSTADSVDKSADIPISPPTHVSGLAQAVERSIPSILPVLTDARREELAQLELDRLEYVKQRRLAKPKAKYPCEKCGIGEQLCNSYLCLDCKPVVNPVAYLLSKVVPDTRPDYEIIFGVA